jgi:hypothetical protein
MECLITSLVFELFESIIHMELDSTVTNHEAIGDVAIAKREERSAERTVENSTKPPSTTI